LEIDKALLGIALCAVLLTACTFTINVAQTEFHTDPTEDLQQQGK